jgi:Bacterial PH domain
VHVRDPGNPDEPSGRPSEPASEITFRVPTGVIVIKFGLAAVILAATLLSGDRLAVLVGVAGALALTVVGLRDVLARDRLRADAKGVDLVHGYRGRAHLDWAEIEQLRIDERPRLGVRAQLLEVDADDHLYLFSRYDLGVQPDEALQALLQVRGDR